MEDNNVEVESTEVTPDRQPATLSIRETLKQQLSNVKDEDTTEEETTETKEESNSNAVVSQQVVQPEVIPMVPPADMNAAEKDAFLNPSSANAHILQSYLNRRAYETKTQYDRKMQEVNKLREQTSGLYDTIKQYENEYAKDGISLSDVARRSIAWDMAMQKNPVETALDWLNSYGVSPQDLYNFQQTATQQQPPQYLTKEEAERIAEERYQALAATEQKKAVELYNQRVVESFIGQKPLFRDPETASQLEAEMAPVVQALTTTGRYSSPEEILETAYNYVVNGNPTFASIVQKMNAKPVIQQQQAVVQKAKAASKSISGSAGSGTPRIVTDNIRDNLRRRMSGE